MTTTEQATANMHLMTRLKPFLANPLTNTPISAFFYNEQRSRQKTVDTNASGHFSFRAALDFVPTHVRILASENLSATEEVQILEPCGVSVISDIDDTIKHSAINSGPKIIFQNVFIRDLKDLKVPGVENWYHKLAVQGVTFHYVSNSPWQLYPLLTEFFSQANLPAGSFHLKQYTGMFQGIFEPVAERKKVTLDKITRDFPERRFILVGDSGEADLEVYTDFVLENPDRELGIFIRDVTTPSQKRFFDSAMGPLSGESHSRKTPGSNVQPGPSVRNTRDAMQNDQELRLAKVKSSQESQIKEKYVQEADVKEARPKLPPRRKTEPTTHEEDLIDLDFDNHSTSRTQQADPQTAGDTKLQPPPRPEKPRSLSPNHAEDHEKSASGKTPPPRPRKPSSSVNIDHISDTKPTMAAAPPKIDRVSKPPRPDPPPSRQTYSSAARQKLSSAYNALPSIYNQQPQATYRSSIRAGSPLRETSTSEGPEAPPPVPPRKTGSFPATMLNSNLRTTSYLSNASAPPSVPLNKKEELWKRRWARAKGILDSKGVVLRSWRVGSDAEAEALRLVERANREGNETS